MATNHTLIFAVLIGVAFAQECPVRSATTFLIAPDGCDCRLSRLSSSCVWEDSECVTDGLLGSWAVSVSGSPLTEDGRRCEVGIEVPPEAMEGSRQVTMPYCVNMTYTLTISNGNSYLWLIAVGVAVGIIVVGIAVGLAIAVQRYRRNKKGTHTLGNGENGDGDGGNPGRPIAGSGNADTFDAGDGGMTGDTSGPTDYVDGHDTMLPMNVVMATKNLSPRTFPATAYSRRMSEPSGEHFNGSASAIDRSIVKTFSCGQLQQGQETQSPTQVSDQQPAQPVVAFGRDATVLPLRTSSSITFIGEK